MESRTRLKIQDQQSDCETENFTESSSQINKTWINTAKDRGRWAPLEENSTMTSEERQETIRESEEILTTYQRGTSME